MLSKPVGGWMAIELKDEKTRVQFPVSYIQDPIQELLELFISICYEEAKDGLFPIPSICFDGEGFDTIVTFLDYATLVTVLKDEAETIIIYKDWIDILKEFMNDVNRDEFLEDYFESFYYDDKESEEVLKALRNNLNDKIKKLKI